MKAVPSREKRRMTPSSRAEQGFVQGVLLFALAVLVAIIAAFAFANTGSQNSADRENAKVNATVLMKQASDVQDAVSRYISDGYSLSNLCVTSGVSGTASPGTTSAGTCGDTTAPVDLWSSSYGYISPPVPPASVFRGDAADRTWRYANFSAAGRNQTASATDPGSYAFMEANYIDKKACQSINRMLSLEFPLAITGNQGKKEMCYESGTTAGTYVYRKVIASRESVGQ